MFSEQHATFDNRVTLTCDLLPSVIACRVPAVEYVYQVWCW